MNYSMEHIIQDFSGSGESTIIESLSKYVSDKDAVSIAHATGLVFCSNRSSTEGAEWDAYYDHHREPSKTYRPQSPIMRSRHALIQHTLEGISRPDIEIIDIGAGDGVLKKNFPNAKRYFAVEPSNVCCDQLNRKGIENFNGSLSEFVEKDDSKFDLAIMSWVLCNTQNCLQTISLAQKVLRQGGLILVAESSRINVPFKKPCFNVFPPNSSNVHPWFFSANTLRLLLGVSGLNPIYINRYWDQNDLIVIAKKEPVSPEVFLLRDDYLSTIDFFKRWVEDDRHWQEWMAHGY